MRRLAFVLPLATLLWLLALSWWFHRPAQHASAQALAQRQLTVSTTDTLRRANPEWDFMGRTFFVLGLSNLARRYPEQRDAYLQAIDRTIDETLDLERAHGTDYFLMAYGKGVTTSLFVDSEVALMLAARRDVAERDDYRALFSDRIAAMTRQLSANGWAPSYPDECWSFDHAMALAALQRSDRLDGTDHRALIAAVLQRARTELIDRDTGLLNSSFRRDGTALDGPEGSTIFLAAAMLREVDEPFARAQYEVARAELFHTIAGFGLAREWPKHATARHDIDSGLQIPVVEASPSASGFALVAASAFDDRETLNALLASLAYAGFPIHDEHGLHHAAGNQVGDAVLLYALSLQETQS